MWWAALLLRDGIGKLKIATGQDGAVGEGPYTTPGRHPAWAYPLWDRRLSGPVGPPARAS